MLIEIGQPPARMDMTVMQQRQAYPFKNPTYIYPVIPAYAATMLQSKGHKVIWRDCIAEQITWDKYKENLFSGTTPDWIFWEVKTPTVKTVWRMVHEIRTKDPSINIGLFGDHVTALPLETTENSLVTTVIVGGNYDLGIAELIDHYSGNRTAPREWFCPDKIPSELPLIDRDLTKWRNYASRNGNFKTKSGTYTQVGRDCWWRKGGGCKFCSWTATHPAFSVVSPSCAIREVENCLRYGVNEIFDDSGTFPTGRWLRDFTQDLTKINKRGRHGHRIRFGCNIRANGFGEDELFCLAKSGFKFVLLGMESANQSTLDRLNKGERVEDLENTLRMAKRAGLEPHITIMVGFPWEGEKEIAHTVDTARRYFARGLIRSLQATVCVPYPGTGLFREAKLNDWLWTYDWDDYDMTSSVFKLQYRANKYIAELYKTAMHPMNVIRRVFSIRSLDDLTYLMRSVKYVLNHMEDLK